MTIFQFLRKRPTAPVARDRLQILLAHERAAIGGSDIVALLQDEIIAVIRKHLPVDRDKVHIKLDRGDSVSTLEIEVEMPAVVPPRRVAVGA